MIQVTRTPLRKERICKRSGRRSYYRSQYGLTTWFLCKFDWISGIFEKLWCEFVSGKRELIKINYRRSLIYCLRITGKRIWRVRLEKFCCRVFGRTHFTWKRLFWACNWIFVTSMRDTHTHINSFNGRHVADMRMFRYLRLLKALIYLLTRYFTYYLNIITI